MSNRFLVADYGGGPDKTPEENRLAYDAALDACLAAGGGYVVLTDGDYGPPALKDSEER
jgi:hypothetical protein